MIQLYKKDPRVLAVAFAAMRTAALALLRREGEEDLTQ